MRSEFETFSTLARLAADPQNPHRLLAASELERLARHHRALVVGAAIADAVLWLARLPGRLTGFLRAGELPARSTR